VTRDTLQVLVEGEVLSPSEPEHFAKNTDAGSNRWIKIQGYGRTLSGMRATQPVQAPSATAGKRFAVPGNIGCICSAPARWKCHDHVAHLEFCAGRGLRVAVPLTTSHHKSSRSCRPITRRRTAIVTGKKLS